MKSLSYINYVFKYYIYFYFCIFINFFIKQFWIYRLDTRNWDRQVPSFRLSLQLGTHMHWLHSPNPQLYHLPRNPAFLLVTLLPCLLVCSAWNPASSYALLWTLLSSVLCSVPCFLLCSAGPSCRDNLKLICIGCIAQIPRFPAVPSFLEPGMFRAWEKLENFLSDVLTGVQNWKRKRGKSRPSYFASQIRHCDSFLLLFFPCFFSSWTGTMCLFRKITNRAFKWLFCSWNEALCTFKLVFFWS